MAIEVVWDEDLSRRIDDAADPFYCEYLAVGTIAGRDVAVRAESIVDLRPGSKVATRMEPAALDEARAQIGDVARRIARVEALKQIGALRHHFDNKTLDAPRMTISGLRPVREIVFPELRPRAAGGSRR